MVFLLLKSDRKAEVRSDSACAVSKQFLRYQGRPNAAAGLHPLGCCLSLLALLWSRPVPNSCSVSRGETTLRRATSHDRHSLCCGCPHLATKRPPTPRSRAGVRVEERWCFSAKTLARTITNATENEIQALLEGTTIRLSASSRERCLTSAISDFQCLAKVEEAAAESGGLSLWAFAMFAEGLRHNAMVNFPAFFHSNWGIPNLSSNPGFIKMTWLDYAPDRRSPSLLMNGGQRRRRSTSAHLRVTFAGSTWCSSPIT